MHAFVLCAGLGTRMRPLTDALPKPALPLLGVPLVCYTFSHLATQDVDALVANTHHLPEVMARVAREAAATCSLPLAISHEASLQGTGGALREARAHLPPGEPFVLWNGDILAEIDLRAALAAHRKANAVATMILRPMPAGEAYGAVEIDALGLVRRIAGHGPGGAGLTSWHFSGVHIVEPEVVRAVAPTGAPCINRDVYAGLIARGARVHGHVAHDGYWSDLGTPARYLATQAELMHGALDFARFPHVAPLSPPSRSGIWRQLGAQVSPLAQVIPPAWIGPRARVAASACLGPNAAVNGAVAGAVRDGALLEGEVKPGESLNGAVRLGPHTAR